MTSTMDPSLERHSWEQFLQLPDLSDGRRPRALIDGEVIYVAPPSSAHGYLCARLQAALVVWCDTGARRGVPIADPLVRVDARPLGYEGDVGWFPEERTSFEAGLLRTSGIPAIVAEVWSPTNWAAEQALKQRDFALAGVAELWGVFPERQVIVRMSDPSNGAYSRIVELAIGSSLTTPLLPGFSLEIGSLFKR